MIAEPQTNECQKLCDEAKAVYEQAHGVGTGNRVWVHYEQEAHGDGRTSSGFTIYFSRSSYESRFVSDTNAADALQKMRNKIGEDVLNAAAGYDRIALGC